MFSILLFSCQYYHQFWFRDKANIQDLHLHCRRHFEALMILLCPTMLRFRSTDRISWITVRTALICQVMKDGYLFHLSLLDKPHLNSFLYRYNFKSSIFFLEHLFIKKQHFLKLFSIACSMVTYLCITPKWKSKHMGFGKS